ncbi:MAG: hypothetical protein RJQ03_03510, partial [Miltoncostaeaceae bacterium]
RERLRAWAAPGGPRWPIALVAYLAAAVVATWPLAGRLTSHTFGGPGDGWALMWQTWERARSGPSYFRVDRYEDLAAPFGTDTSTAAFLSNALVELPHIALLKLGVGDILAYNLLTLAALVGSSLAMYLLVRRVGASAAVAGWAGLVYMWVPWHLEKAAIHLQLSTLVWLPLALLAVIEFARRPGLRTSLWLVGASAIGIYTHVYYGLMAALVLVVASPVVLGFALGRRRLARTARWMAAVAGGVILAALPLAVALRLQSEEIGLLIDRPLSLTSLAGSTHRYLLPPVGNPLLGDHSLRYLTDNGLPVTDGELALYLGWVTIALALVGVAVAVRGGVPRLPVVLGLVVVGTGLFFALPATVDIPLLGTLNAPVHYLVEVVDFLSTPSRFVVFTITGLILVGALGLEWLRRGAGGRVAGIALVVGVSVLSGAELIAHTDGRVVDARPDAVTRLILDGVPAGEPVAQYPSTERSLRPVADHLYGQTHHGRPLVNGASVGTVEDVVRRELERIDRPETPRVLRLLGVEWATVEPALYDFAPGQEYPAEAFGEDEDPPGWRTVRGGPAGERLLRITSPPATGFGARADGFYFEYLDLHWMTGLSANLLVCSDRAGRRTLSFDANAFGGHRRLLVGGVERRLQSAPEPTPMRVRLPLQAGWQWVPLRVVGSQPVRPIDLVPASGDDRELAVSIGLVDVLGGDGAPVQAPCSGPIPPRPGS